MKDLQITLADGRFTQADKLQAYFSGIFEAEDSGEEFPVDLNHVWPIGYTRKDNASAALRRSFVEGVDYQVSLRVQENPEGGRPEEVYTLSVSCLEYFVVRVNRAVFEVYRECRRAVRKLLRNALPDFNNPVAAARAWADAQEAKQLLQQKIEEDAPKVALAENIAVSVNSLSFRAAAQWLKIPVTEGSKKTLGQNQLIDLLRADGILMKNREPYKKYADYFEVQPQTYKAGEKGQRMTGTTRVTPKGLEWLAKRYKPTVVAD